MALIKTKQVAGLDSALAAKLEAADLNPLESSVDSLEGDVSSIDTRVGAVETLNTAQDASIDSLEIAVSNGTGDLEASVDSLEGDVSSIDTRAGAIETLNTAQDASIDSLEGNVSSIDTRAGAIETLNTAQDASIDSLETQVGAVETLNTAQNASIDSLETLVTEYALDQFESGYGTLAGGAILGIDGVGSIGSINITDPAAGEFNLDLNTAIEGANVREHEQNIIGIFVNGIKATPDEIEVVASTSVNVNLPYPIDAGDVLEVKYNKIG